MILRDPKYVISPFHLQFLKPYEVLAFDNFPILEISVDQSGAKFLNLFWERVGEFNHHILRKTSYATIKKIFHKQVTVREAFESEHENERLVYSCFYKVGSIAECYAIPLNEFIQGNPITDDLSISVDFEIPNEKAEYSSYNSKIFAHELTKRVPSNAVEKLTSTLLDAQVDIHPWQVDAALFAFHSPLSNGALLADEVGLGKTIEAGLVISQHWAERKRKILIIVPANIRKQWSLELSDKFFIPSFLLETKSFNAETKERNFNPFDQKNKVVICSYQFARQKESYVKSMPWDLVVIDEAHRLRNVYKTSNKIAVAIKDALRDRKKILLTATPLQNSLLELFGLVSIIDETAFGDLKSFKAQYSRTDETQPNYEQLRKRLEPICKRTLRKQVREYVQYTNRHAIVQEFSPSPQEQELYDVVSDYLQRDQLYALPQSQRQLMTLILRRLLASSTYAISGTLKVLADKLEGFLKSTEPMQDIESKVEENFEQVDQYKDEWQSDDQKEIAEPKSQLPKEEIAIIRKEIDDLNRFHQLANSVIRDSKGEKLLIALSQGFQEIKRLNAGKEKVYKKAIIFTESTRTQNYIKDILEESEFKGKWIFFNGSNNDPRSREVYKKWIEKNKDSDRISSSRSADIRTALVDYFRDEAEIMIATEAAAEGLNLQFCSLLINYDMPWNPQRIEQRIGRIHRYGQENDVVIVNFLNQKNEADLRVYELLAEKFKLFSGVFGASDEVLGAIESGVDFEKRIAGIYQACRMPEEIKSAFDKLQDELDEQINQNLKETSRKLLENFDVDVIESLRELKNKTEVFLKGQEKKLWNLAQHQLKSYAEFDEENHSFLLHQNPTDDPEISSGPYKIGKNIEHAHVFRVGHPLSQYIIEKSKESETAHAHLFFDFKNTLPKHSLLEQYVGQSGWIRADLFSIESFEGEDHILYAGITEDLEPVDHELCQKILLLPCIIKENLPLNYEAMLQHLPKGIEKNAKTVLKESELRNEKFFEQEADKLDQWARDLKQSYEIELDLMKKELKTRRTEWRKIQVLAVKVEARQIINEMEKKIHQLRNTIDERQHEIESKQDELIENVKARMQHKTEQKELFTIRWTLI